MSAHAYRTTRKPRRSEATRERIKTAVRELLAEGTFHTSTVEHVADRAGISRATLYQHFRSRLELIDAICSSASRNPSFRETASKPRRSDARAVGGGFVRAAFPSDASGELSGDLGDGAAADTGMEPLWSPVVATGGNQWQID